MWGGTNTWTDIFEGLYEERRLCPFSNFIENESHIVLLNCHLHNNLITALYETAISYLPDFANYNRTDTLRVILSDLLKFLLKPAVIFERDDNLICVQINYY